MAGWWLYGVCCQIGAIAGPWTADPVTGRIVKQGGKGARRSRPDLVGGGMGVNRPQLREPGVGEDPEFHPHTMPGLIRWFAWLSARLRHVRICNGDWSRVVTTGAALTLPVRQGKGPAGIFLDPPYDTKERDSGLYAQDSEGLAAKVRQWCLETGKDKRYRIVLAGYDTEHAVLEEHGWSVHEWFKDGYLTGGYGNVAKGRGTGTHQQHRERLWASPHCVVPQRSLFDALETNP